MKKIVRGYRNTQLFVVLGSGHSPQQFRVDSQFTAVSPGPDVVLEHIRLLGQRVLDESAEGKHRSHGYGRIIFSPDIARWRCGSGCFLLTGGTRPSHSDDQAEHEKNRGQSYFRFAIFPLRRVVSSHRVPGGVEWSLDDAGGGVKDVRAGGAGGAGGAVGEVGKRMAIRVRWGRSPSAGSPCAGSRMVATHRRSRYRDLRRLHISSAAATACRLTAMLSP